MAAREILRSRTNWRFARVSASRRIRKSTPPSRCLSEPALQVLTVARAYLGLDRAAERGVRDDCVPCSQIARVGQRHLRPPAQVGVEPGAELLEQRSVGSVPNRRAGRKRADRKLESNDRGQTDEILERHGVL
jgi:hypothetical protein